MNEKLIIQENHIAKLESDLINEKDFNLKVFVDEKVTQLCQKAYFSFE